MSLLNKQNVRRYILEAWKLRRAWPLTRVSSEAMVDLETRLKRQIDLLIEEHPSVGRTFRP